MAHITATGLFLVLLLCSAILGGSTATEHNVTTISTESRGDKQDNANIIKELEKEKRKYLTGRKMGGFDVKKDPTKTGANPSIGENVNGMKQELNNTFKGGSGKASVAGLTLNSDYHRPRSHTPVHN